MLRLPIERMALSVKQLIKSLLLPHGYRNYKILGGALKGFRFSFDLQLDTQLWRGVYERALQDWLVRSVTRGGFCIDVGADQGYFSLLMAALAGSTGRVCAFEPSDHHQAVLRNIELNKARELANVEAIQAFVGAENIEAMPPTVTLDAYLATMPTYQRVDVVKVDVEGKESSVLRGFSKGLARDKPKLFIEVHSPDLRSEVQQILLNLNYQTRLLAPAPHEQRFGYNAYILAE